MLVSGTLEFPLEDAIFEAMPTSISASVIPSSTRNLRNAVLSSRMSSSLLAVTPVSKEDTFWMNRRLRRTEKAKSQPFLAAMD